MKLSTRSRYGTRILLELARQSDTAPVKVNTISKQQDIPVKYLEQLIRTLKKAELISSVRGAKGGYNLTRKPEDITLGEIVRLFEEQHELVRCISSPDVCHRADDCHVRLAWMEATEALYERLDTITIADLLCEPPRLVKNTGEKRLQPL